jgi:hypothetical protein
MRKEKRNSSTLATPRIFRTTRWYRMIATVASLLIAAAGLYYVMWGSTRWYQAGGAAAILFGLAAFADVLVSRIVLADEAIHIVSLVRRRSYPRTDFESAKVDGSAVAMKRRDGGWVVLPSTGHNALAVRNTVHAWIKAGL